MSLLLAACGGGGGPDTGTPQAGAAGAETPAVSSAAAPAPDALELGAPLAAAQAELQAQQQAQAAQAGVQAEVLAQTQAALATGLPTATLASTANSTAAAGSEAPTLQALAATPTLTVRARADVAGNVGALMQVRVGGTTLGTVEVKDTAFANYSFSAPTLKAGALVDVAFTNDAVVGGADRNLYVASISDGSLVLAPTATSAVLDKGAGSAAFDGKDVIPGQSGLFWSGALRFTWPGGETSAVASTLPRQRDAVRFLQQASFGATPALVNQLVTQSYADWIAQQQALPWAPHFVNAVQARYALGDAWRPGGANYTPAWVGQTFWERAANAPDQLRQRVGLALHQVFMVSQADSNLWHHGRAYAHYVDLLHKHAFGNFRTLLEDMALSPAMGIYLSHLRNRKEDPATGRVPDENFARELMQLFSIGLVELNPDGSVKLDASGKPIETYTTADVVAMAKVFTGFSWAYPDAQLTDSTFRWSSPSLAAAKDTQIDLLPMKAYPNQHSSGAKTLFAGKAWAVTLPAGNSAQADVKAALDALFKHPNVGPFIGRQLIQRLVTSQPSPAYVARISAVFNNNGAGVRGDLGAVVRAILLDPEARTAGASPGKLREPVLRLAAWMRALGATSTSGEYLLAWLQDDQGQRIYAAPSVFGYFRPGYVPPNTALAKTGTTAPEFQILNESTVAAWLNMAEAMAGNGVGWNAAKGSTDVAAPYTAQAALAGQANLMALPDQLDLLLLGGRMSPALRRLITDTMSSVNASTPAETQLHRARAAVFLTLASAEYAHQP